MERVGPGRTNPHEKAREHGTAFIHFFSNLLSLIIDFHLFIYLSLFICIYQSSGTALVGGARLPFFHSSARCEFMPTQIPTLARRALTFSHEVGRAAKFLI